MTNVTKPLKPLILEQCQPDCRQSGWVTLLVNYGASRFSIRWNHLIEKKRSQIKGPSILSALNWAQDALKRLSLSWKEESEKKLPCSRAVPA